MKKELILKEKLYTHWGNGKPMEMRDKRYRVGRMSYGAYFLEPFNPKYPLGKGENYPFERGTLWAEKVDKDTYEV